LLIKPDDQQRTFETLKEQGILVRPRKGPNIAGTIRVSIGTIENTERFIRAFSKLLR
jgi:histidinol-phosphate/aromatic aminotransferase/cobyric acid decarboxylase-like protein